MSKLKLLISLIVFLGSLATGRAAHLVGGEITYRCLGNNNYEITLLIYRDCKSTGAAFDQQAVITIYSNVNNWIVSNDSVQLLSISTLPLVAPNNCTSLPSTVCTEKGIYKYTVHLPPISGGYTITHQRCCRNTTISNINNGNSQWGSTYTNSIPPNDISCNSSPKFNGDPPVVLCMNINVDLDLSASDTDGDSLHYELCEVLNGGSNSGGNIAPNPAAPPPYQNVPFLPGYTTSNPITSLPSFTIDPVTGILSGTPKQVGQFVFAICVSEYRNGAWLSTTRRDFQFNVSNACQAIIARVEDQALGPHNFCTGGVIKFQNRSQFASSYFWDFGDTTLLNDTSRQANPTYYYQDTGVYKVMLVAEPRTTCADTTYAIFRVFDSTKVAFTFKGNQCLENNLLDFTAFGEFSANASFSWDFGGNTNLGSSSNQRSPKGVTWQQPGSYFVTVTVTDFGCGDTYGDTLDIFVQPEINEHVEKTQACLPYTVHFEDKSKAMGPVQHWWVFGDGDVSTLPNPSHTYTSPGFYTVEHSIKTVKGCIDTGYSIYPEIISIFPVPASRLEWQSKEQSIFDPTFEVTNSSEGYTHSLTVLPDGQEIANLTRAVFSLDDTGNFEVFHLSFNEYGCSDTLVDTIRVDDPFSLFIPSAFTPDGDGINDEFIFKMSGIASMQIEIYNRWGQVIYRSSDPVEGWNGRNGNSGDPLPSGVYSYVFIGEIRDGGRELVETGTVTLLR